MNRVRYPAILEHPPQHGWFVKEVRSAQRALAAGAPNDEVAMRLNELLRSCVFEGAAVFLLDGVRTR